MKQPNTDILISGASVAGPTLAYWLRRHGFNPTVVERTPSLRKGLGSHAVDLPVSVQHRLSALQGGPARALSAINLNHYEPIR
jgi:2-polyprenyl-6-methoxyphenol hydroxylase-like FAD-dependent oxidoreductase